MKTNHRRKNPGNQPRKDTTTYGTAAHTARSWARAQRRRARNARARAAAYVRDHVNAFLNEDDEPLESEDD